MRVFVAGGTGALGSQLIPLLVEAGHSVGALSRSAEKAAVAEAMGAEPIIAAALDRTALMQAVRASRPDVIVHQLTALAGAGNFRKLDEEFELTNRFRTTVTDTLLAAARDVGAQRFIAQSFCGWPFAREGGRIKTEDDPLDKNPPRSFRKTLAAIQYLEDTATKTRDTEALVLRYGLFYGPRTGIAVDGSSVAMIRKRRLPIVGGGGGVWSFIHIRDAASATVAAVTMGSPGIYNIVDDEPAPVATWLPALAEAVGAPPPRRVPAWVGRIALGAGGLAVMTENRGGSNAKAKRELGWRPRYATWRHGFAAGLG
jgi:nucleoside-diphosphate-sugar epimerase